MLKDLVCLITGAASGLGKATAEKLIKEGGKVILCDIQKPKGEEVAAALGSNATFVHTDVTSETEVENAVGVTKSLHNKLDVIVNCAGTSAAFQVYNFNKRQPHLLSDFIRIFTVNCAGSFNVLRLGIGLMGDNKPDEDGYKGVIINTSSFAADDGHTAQVAYAASVGAINSMTLPLCRDLGKHGIRVCTIAPGLFETPMTSPFPEKVRTFLNHTSQFPHRFGKPEEFAHCVAMVIENKMLNGTIIRLDGGMRLI